QSVKIGAGRYRASVYVRDLPQFSDYGLALRIADPPPSVDGGLDAGTDADAGLTNEVDVTSVQTGTVAGEGDPDAGPTVWPRAYVIFAVEAPKILTFAFRRPTTSSMQPANGIVLAAPMLERLPSTDLDIVGPEPSPFVNTTNVRTRILPMCED